MKSLKTLCVVLLALPCVALATPIPDTGHTKCYDDVEEITYPSPGEPFYGQDAQYITNPHSYIKLDENGDDLPPEATEWVRVRDNLTKLIWEVKTDNDPPDIHDKDDNYTWQNAQDVFIATLNSQNFGGHNDWRMPTVNELSNILDSSVPYPGAGAINTDYFPNTRSNYYWSSTPLVYDPNDAWYVNFIGSGVHSLGKANVYYTRAVRGGQTSNDFIDNGNGTITDTSTGLMWQKDTDPGIYNWQQALSYCETLTLADYDDWRLPNKNELQSLVDYSQSYPSIDTTYFPNTLGLYWLSTTHVFAPERAWYTSFGHGDVGTKPKSLDLYVGAVRGGQCESQPIPTLTEWGLIIFMTLMMAIGVVILRNRRIV